MSAQYDFIAQLGHLALTLRLKRLADKLSESGRRLYNQLGLELEPSWYAVFLLLKERQTLTITETARLLGLSHPSIVATTRKMEKHGYLKTMNDEQDKRRRMLSLSEKAWSQMDAFEEVWQAFRDAMADLVKETGSDPGPWLQRMENLLAEKPLDERVAAQLQPGPQAPHRPREKATGQWSIQPLTAGDRNALLRMTKSLRRAGDSYALAADADDDALWAYWNPEGKGRGYAAHLDGELVGAFVIRTNHPGPASHIANASYAVRADMRGLGIGRKMGVASLQLARSLGYTAMQFNIVVSTNHVAVNLWRDLGFSHIGTTPRGYVLPDGTAVDTFIMYRELDT